MDMSGKLSAGHAGRRHSKPPPSLPSRTAGLHGAQASPGEFHHPVGLPGSLVIDGKGLLPASRDWCDFRPDVTCPHILALICVVAVEKPAPFRNWPCTGGCSRPSRLFAQYSHHSCRAGSSRRRVKPLKPLAGKSNSSRLAAPPKRRIRFDVPGNSSQSLLPASNSLSHRLATSQDPTIKSKSLIVITFLYRKSPRALQPLVQRRLRAGRIGIPYSPLRGYWSLLEAGERGTGVGLGPAWRRSGAHRSNPGPP